MHLKTTVPVTDISHTDNYGEMLKEYGLEYKTTGYYLQVGEINLVQGWILHISIIRTQILDLLRAIIPELTLVKVSFKIPKDKETATLLVSGTLGYEQLGKVVCIYPHNNELAVYLVKKLIPLTVYFRGPAIPTDIHLGSNVYTRYGAFNPKIFCDDNGKRDSYIYNANGRLVKDIQHIPFKLPEDIDWPFGEISSPANTIPNTLLNHAYKAVSVLKADTKGRVIKSLRLKGFRIQWCIVKEGKQNMSADDAGRDIQDRLRWQYQLQQKLGNDLPLPKVYDFFHEDGNTYLVMEYIKGSSLQNVISTIYENTCWIHLEQKKQLILLEHLIKIIVIIERLHKRDYIHRDITPANFILNRKNKFIMIDLELAYTQNSETLVPPFTLGTEGFMSPEQQEVQQPTVQEDIYGLGALMIVFFTNLFPTKFGTASLERLEDDLNFFIQNRDIAHLIAQCFNYDPEARPQLFLLKKTIQQYYNEAIISANQKETLPPPSRVDTSKIQQIIDDSLLALNNRLLKEPGKMWHSNTSILEKNHVVNKAITRAYYAGIYAGISGVMYLLARAKGVGFAVNNLMEGYEKGHEYFQRNHLNAPNVIPGLYAGAAGVAIAIGSGIENGLLNHTSDNIKIMQQCLSLTSTEQDLANGVAGQGIAVLYCLPHLDKSLSQRLLQKHVALLLDNQQNDGSWQFLAVDKSNRIKITGFAHGIAGLLYFLLEYYGYYPENGVRESILKGLNWLYKQAKKTRNGLQWYTNNKEKLTSAWLQDGVAGIALCLTRAYEIFRDPLYKRLAVQALNSNPRYLTNGNLSHAHGITGIGEVYLEAYHVFQQEQWKERADWIANLLVHTCHYHQNGSCSWHVDEYLPTADLMIGHSGIIHFLLRCNSLNKLRFPLSSSHILTT